ncbi:MAG TPA: hypothetical protein DCP31_17355 [Cyanobacteria bacterium UBA8543]|nr:hypothetical protein [Cyanobacteria bacterium UBA8543]
MREAHGIVTRNLTRNLPPKESGKRKQSDILVSYLDGAAKSGAESANLYVDEASLYVDNLVEKGNLKEKLLASKAAKALVFIDDFVGTGESASKYLSEIDATIAESVQERQIKVVFVALIAFVEGWKRVEEAVDNLSMHVHTHRCELLDETAQYFSDKLSVFTDTNQRELARQVALKVGKELVKKIPLGYGDIEMGVVFERGCPNNSLPILWAESTNPKWTPLFKRL